MTAGYFFTIRHYQKKDFGLKSDIADSLNIFLYNESVFNDPALNCWYDSGDYVVFLHRNIQTFYYLSLAYSEAKTPLVKEDIKYVLDRQKECIDKMLDEDYKQFGDQNSHGINLPPLFHSIFYPQHHYQLKGNEGKDVYLLYRLALQNLGHVGEADSWLVRLQDRKEMTISENCCEEGPLKLTLKDSAAIENIYNKNLKEAEADWGLSFANIAFLKSKKYGEVKSHLTDLVDIWKDGKDSDYHYIGGNYDIAGTIAFERLYARETGDNSFFDLSRSMMAYLEGKNQYDINFLNYQDKYHPCDFFGRCNLKNTLINGIDETHEFNIKRKDVWRLTEVQLIGQAQYVLAYILYNDS